MAYVEIANRNDFEKAFRVFKRQVEKSGLVAEVTERARFKKPSLVRKIKRKAAVKRGYRKSTENELPPRFF